MTRSSGNPYWVFALVAAVFLIPLLPYGSASQGAALAAGQSALAAGSANLDCPYFKNFQQHSPREGLQRIGPWEATAQSLEAGQRTLTVTKALAGEAGASAAVVPVSLSFIDSYIFSTLAEKGIAPANPSSDLEFLRRVTLDLTGRIPSPEEIDAFLADEYAQRRAWAIDRLLGSPEWVDRWTMWLGDLLKNNTRSTQVVRYAQGRNAFQQYIRTSLEQNKPYNQLVAELIPAAGDSFEKGQVNFTVGGQMSMGPAQDTYDKQWVQVATVFLGLKNFDCLLCHNGAGHLNAINLWASRVTRSEAWELAAFFSRTQITRPYRDPGTSYVVVERTTGDYTLNTNSGNRPSRQPATGQSRTVRPRYLFSNRRAGNGENYRQVAAQEVTSDFQFARATVNYVWKHFFTLGIVEPPDAFDLARLDPKNPPPEPWTLQPSHPELLEELARIFIAGNYDLKALMREICNSYAYQLSSRYPNPWNPADARWQARHLVRRLESEELHDALVQSSGVPSVLRVTGHEDPIPWAMQLPDTSEPGGATGAFLNTFLRGDRDENPRRGDLSPAQALDLMNDAFVIQRARASTANGLLARLLASGMDDGQLVGTLYLNVLSRYPGPGEMDAGVKLLRSGTRRTKAEDLLWSLYNKVDFIFNY